MALTKRGAVWWIDFVSPNGERIRESAETGDRRQPQGLHDQLRSTPRRLRPQCERHGHIRGTTDGFPRRTICNSLKSSGSVMKRMPTRGFFARVPRPTQVVESVRHRIDSRISGHRIDRQKFFLTH